LRLKQNHPLAHPLSKAWSWTKRILLFLIISQFIYLVALKWIYPPLTITQMSSFLSGDGMSRDHVGGANISRNLKLAVVASEDQLFPDHNGFDFKSIQRAMAYNKKKPGRIRGASTISQQVAKNVFLWQGRSWFRKALEVYFTFMIELVWGKGRILEIYLDVAEMGKGVFGAEAAAQQLFHKSARNLTISESAMIAASLPNPRAYTVKPMSRYVSVKYPWIIRQMSNLSDDPDVLALIK
jgi:monofunctional biosynthetic peptidoglycan transglycosylase